MAKAEEKTNVMRVLDSKKVSYKKYTYENAEGMTGLDIARTLGQNPAQVFKTLVTYGSKTKNYYVFVIPVEAELDLKAAAKAVEEKSVEMIKQKDLLPLTGYIHGGCSPIGMKKFFRTTVHESARNFETIIFSAGKVGYQVEVAPGDLEKVIRLQYSNIVTEI